MPEALLPGVPTVSPCILYQLPVDVLSAKFQCLFFQVLRVGYMLVFPALFLYLCPGLCRSTYSPQLVESVHVERQVIQFSFIIGNRRVGVSVELNKPVHIIPYFPVVCMKDMRTVFMHVDTVYFFAVDIAAGVWTFLYHQTSLSGFMSLMGKHGSEQAAATIR